MSGVWRRHREIPDRGETSDITTIFNQRGTDVIAGELVGTIDPATGAFDLRTFNPSVWCLPFDRMTGSVAPSGLTYTASGSIELPDELAPDTCNSFALTETGTRCASGSIEMGESCDDGNMIDGDGCSAACLVEPCWGCSGQPSTCVPTPRTTCKSSTAPHKSRLSIKNGPDDAVDKITWQWKKGADTAIGELGDPLAGDGYALCIFDESTLPPGLLFRAAIPDGASCGEASCWKAKGEKGFHYKSQSGLPDGVTRTKLGAGAAGRAKAILKGKGVHLSDRAFGLPAPLLPTPLRVQLVGDGGLCLETKHGPEGVLKNDAASGVFKARGTP
jgi:cysteine-rich repeat protein